jgi:hypothetical protein
MTRNSTPWDFNDASNSLKSFVTPIALFVQQPGEERASLLQGHCKMPLTITLTASSAGMPLWLTGPSESASKLAHSICSPSEDGLAEAVQVYQTVGLLETRACSRPVEASEFQPRRGGENPAAKAGTPGSFARARFARQAAHSRSPQVWEALLGATRRADVALRLQMLESATYANLDEVRRKWQLHPPNSLVRYQRLA